MNSTDFKLFFTLFLSNGANLVSVILGSKEHMNLPRAWNKAITLSQCKCDIQEGIIFSNYIFVNYFESF